MGRQIRVQKSALAGRIANTAFYDLKKYVPQVGELPILDQEKMRDIIREAALNIFCDLEENIGEFLLRIGAMNRSQVHEVLAAQRRGDGRLFGDIAVEMGYIEQEAIQKYLRSRRAGG